MDIFQMIIKSVNNVIIKLVLNATEIDKIVHCVKEINFQ
jgi:hypothetical protein